MTKADLADTLCGAFACLFLAVAGATWWWLG